jgi:hypothetical protein
MTIVLIIKEPCDDVVKKYLEQSIDDITHLIHTERLSEEELELLKNAINDILGEKEVIIVTTTQRIYRKYKALLKKLQAINE